MSRTDDALLAVLLVVVIQSIMASLAKLYSKALNPMPFTEILVRPLIVRLCDKLNRSDRGDFALTVRGVLVFLIILAVISLAGIGLEHLIVMIGAEAYMDVLLLSLLISPITVLSSAYAISHPNPKKGSYRVIAQSLNQNLVISDDFGLRRASAKAIAVAYNEWLVAPVLFYLIGGMPLACLYVSLSLFVRISAKGKAFQSLFGAIYKVFSKIAALFSLLFIATSSVFASGGRPLKVFSSAGKNGLNVESFFAYAQNITLGGSIQNRLGEKVSLGWVGPEGTTAKITRRDVIRLIIHYCIAVFLFTVALFALYAFG